MSHDAHLGDGLNDLCSELDFYSSDSASAGQDDECLGGWNQHNRYGFAQTEQAYTQERYVCRHFH